MEECGDEKYQLRPEIDQDPQLNEFTGADEPTGRQRRSSSVMRRILTDPVGSAWEDAAWSVKSGDSTLHIVNHDTWCRLRLLLLWGQYVQAMRFSWAMRAITLWSLLVAVSGVWLFFLFIGVGMPDRKTDAFWVEIQSQTLCGLFQIAAMLKHPGRTRAVVWLMCPRREDYRLTNAYPELTLPQTGFVLLCFQLNCLAQYACAFFMWYWAADYESRPVWGAPSFLGLSLVSEFIGGVYMARHQASAGSRDNFGRFEETRIGLAFADD